jgi:hypothetical protein
MDVALDTLKFIDLSASSIAFLFIVGFIGGLVSGFIGSGGAFVLTPGMMSLGVSRTVSVASNMCHKFPKALVGAIKRFRYGQVDVKLGLVMAASRGRGVRWASRYRTHSGVLGPGGLEPVREPVLRGRAGHCGRLRFYDAMTSGKKRRGGQGGIAGARLQKDQSSGP